MTLRSLAAMLGGRRFMEPPRFVPLASVNSKAGVRWHPAFDASYPVRPSVQRFGAIDVAWPSLVSAQHPAMGVIELPPGYTLTAAGWARDRSGIAIADTTWYGQAAHGEIKKGRRSSGTRRIRGTALSLLSDFAQGNYYHFLIDALARYALYERVAAHVPRPDVILCPRPYDERLEPWIDRLGIRDCEVELLAGGERVRADRTLVPSFPGERRDCAAWAVQFWRRRLLGNNLKQGTRKLYVQRRSTSRMIVNEAELEAALVARGFETIDPAATPLAETLFADAQVVVGAHGAALTDCMFCPRDAVLVEIVPSDHVFPYYYSLAGATGLRYAYIVGASESQRPPGSWGPSPFNLSVDVAALLVGLDRLDAQSSNQ